MKRLGIASFFPFAAGLLLVAMVLPIASMVISLPPSAVLTAYRDGGADALRTSVEASFIATIVAAFLGIPGGYWLSRCIPRLRAVVLFALALPLAFPPVASGIMLLNVIGPRAPIGAWLLDRGIPIADTLLGVAAAQFFVAGSFIALTSCAAFGTIDPLPEEAARTLGSSEWRIFTRIALPAAANSVAAGVTFAWLRALGEYGATSIVAYHPTTLPVAVYVALSAQGVGPALALCYGFAVLAAAVLGVQWFLRRRVV
jgi:ABC-type sulfate transport system permease component